MAIKQIFILIIINSVYANSFGIALINNDCQIVQHTAYTACYSELHEQSYWVSYTLYREQLKGITFASRDGKEYIPDPQVTTESANVFDYQYSGYDRGHLMPAKDAEWSNHTIDESFQFTNISPQIADFNRGIWKRLENKVREWTIQNGKIDIVTGPILTGTYNTIGPNKVSIPDYFYKVLLIYSESDTTGIGFIMPNQKSDFDIMLYSLTIDSVEAFSGIDFFPSLPDKLEKTVEE